MIKTAISVFYNNQNFENKKTIDTNKKLLEDDLTFNDPFANEIKPSLGVTDGSMIAYNFPTNNQSTEVEPSIINNVVKLAKDFNTNTKEFTFDRDVYSFDSNESTWDRT